LHQVAQEFNVRLEERVGERTRIARELHDTLLQTVQGLMLRLQVVDEMLPPGKVKDELKQTMEVGDQAIIEGRDTVHDLRSPLSENELAQAVRALGDELANGGGTTFRLVVEGPVRELHPIVRDELYRIAREALRNAFAHARAKHIEAEITYDDRLLRLRIRDDGEGISTKTLTDGRSGHFGLAGMRERARQIGSKLMIWSGNGAGTEIEVSVPGSIAYGKPPETSRFRLFRTKVG
jgi:signal transduction histidine kinase